MTARPRPRSAVFPLPETGPLALVWRRLRRLPIDDRNELATVEADSDGVVAIACSGGAHTASVVGDDLDLADHDVEAEVAMLALGAELPACLVHLAVWTQARHDPAFLLAWGDDVEVDGLRAAREDWEGNYWESWPLEPAAARVLFGPRLQRSLALAAARRAVAEAGAGRFDSWFALQRATQTRARRAFVHSLAAVDAHPRPDALVPVQIRVEPPGAAGGGPGAAGRLARTGSRVDLSLPSDWLDTVWRHDLALVDGRFVLARHGDRLTAVAWHASGGADAEHVPSVVQAVAPAASSHATSPSRQGPAPR